MQLYRQIFWLLLVLLLFGQIILFSATGVLGLQKFGSEFYYVFRQAITALLGLVFMISLSHVRYQFWRKVAVLFLAFEIFLMLATLFSPLGQHIQGATRWLRLGPLTFQPSEIARVAVAIYVARFLALRHEKKLKPAQWGLYLTPLLILLFLVFKQPDLGTTVLLATVTLGLFFISGMRPAYLIGLLSAGGGFFVLSMLHSEYRRRRLLAFLDPWVDPQGNGFQAIQSFLSIHSGKLFGTGLGNGNSKLFFLPEVHTDFIFSLVGEELGFLGAMVLLLLLLYFSYLLFKVAFQSKDPFACYLAFGISLSLVFQMVVHLGGATGILPVKGLPLPFFSWGRSSLLVTLCSIGILLNIVRQSGMMRKTDALI